LKQEKRAKGESQNKNPKPKSFSSFLAAPLYQPPPPELLVFGLPTPSTTSPSPANQSFSFPLAKPKRQQPVRSGFLVIFNQILGGDSQNKQTNKNHHQRRVGDVQQNGDSTGKGIVSDNIGLSFVFLMCLSFLCFVLFYLCFINASYIIASCITSLFLKAHTSF
jgi:hypothetical protein